MRYLLLFCAALLCTALSAQSTSWTIQRAVRHALENNLQVRQAALSMQSALIQRDRLKESRYPNLSGSANGGYNIGFVNDPTTNQISNQTIFSSNFSLSSNVNVFSGFQLQNRIRQSLLDLQASELTTEQTRRDVALLVAQNYLNILFQRELLEAAQFQIASTRERRSRTQRLVDAGTLARAELLDLDAQIATEELNVINARNQLQVARLNLQQLLLLDPTADFQVVSPELELPDAPELPVSLQEVYRTALAEQPGIQAADLQVQSAELGVDIAKGGFLPSLGLGGSVSSVFVDVRQRPTDQIDIISSPLNVEINGEPQTFNILQERPIFESYPFFDQVWDQRNYQIGANLSVPIYSRGQNRYDLQQAEVGIAQARLNAEQQRLELKQTLQQAYFDVQAAWASYQANQRQIDALQLALDNAEKQLSLGVINSVDYVLAKNNLNRARTDLLRAKYDYIFRREILEFFQGKPIEL